MVRDYVKKGTQLHIEGKLQTRSWDDKDSGQKKYRTEIFVAELNLLGHVQNSGKTTGSSMAANSQGTANQSRGANTEENTGRLAPGYARSTVSDGTEITDDDIPF